MYGSSARILSIISLNRRRDMDFTLFQQQSTDQPSFDPLNTWSQFESSQFVSEPLFAPTSAGPTNAWTPANFGTQIACEISTGSQKESLVGPKKKIPACEPNVPWGSNKLTTALTLMIRRSMPPS